MDFRFLFLNFFHWLHLHISSQRRSCSLIFLPVNSAMEVPLSYSKSRRSSGRMLRETSVRLLSSPPNLQPRDYKADREFESWSEQYRSLSKRRGADFWKKRQMFLHSYQFTIKKTVPERVKASLRKLKAAAWTIVAGNYCEFSLASRLERFDRCCFGNQEWRI